MQIVELPDRDRVQRLLEKVSFCVAPDAWFAFYAPAGTPRAITGKPAREISRIVGQPNTQEKLALAGFEPAVVSADSVAESISAVRQRYPAFQAV